MTSFHLTSPTASSISLLTTASKAGCSTLRLLSPNSLPARSGSGSSIFVSKESGGLVQVGKSAGWSCCLLYLHSLAIGTSSFPFHPRYDGLSHHDGRLEWRSTLDKRDNLPFYAAASCLFLDYHWFLDSPSQTASLLDTLHLTPPSPSINLSLNPMHSFANKQQHQLTNLKTNIFFGVDMFGRGCLYGGGFSSWKAASVAADHGFSVALFAPGWTWESHHLHPARQRAGTDVWASWWAEERYQWCGLNSEDTEPENTYIDACRIATEAGQRVLPERGSTASEALAHRPLLSLFHPSTRHSLSSASRWPQSFYTNYSLGSGGNGYWVDGHQVLGNGRSWTDMASCFPKPDQSIGCAQRHNLGQPFVPGPGPLVRCDLVEHVGWHGAGSVRIRDKLDIPHDQFGLVWINTLFVKVTERSELRIVWRAEDNALAVAPLGIALDFVLTTPSDSSPSVASCNTSNSDVLLMGPAGVLSVSETRVLDLGNGWQETRCVIDARDAALTKFGLTIPAVTPFQHYLGQFSVSPLRSCTADEASIALTLSDDARTVWWDHRGSETIMYLLFLCRSATEAETLLGTVRDVFIVDGKSRRYGFKLGDVTEDDRPCGSIILKKMDLDGRVKVVGTAKFPEKQAP